MRLTPYGSVKHSTGWCDRLTSNSLSFKKILIWRYVYWFLRERKGEREREKHWCERNTEQLFPVYAPTRDRTNGRCPAWDLPCNLWMCVCVCVCVCVHRTTHQPTEPPSQGLLIIYKRLKNKINLKFRSFAHYYTLLSSESCSSLWSYVGRLNTHPGAVPDLTL